MENQQQQPAALVLASLFERCVIAFGETETSSRAIAAKELRRLHTRVEELEAMLDAVGAGGVSAQRVTQGKDHTEQQVRELLATGSQPQADALDAQRWLDYLIRNQARVCNNLDEYEGDEDCADCGYWLEFTDSNSQRWVQIGVFKNPRDAIDAAIVAAKEMK